MTLSFPNTSRSYNSTKQCVCFRGYDSVFEVSFELDEQALRAMSPQGAQDEASMLAVFDRNRGKIERAASAAYSRRRRVKLHSISRTDF